MSNNLDKLFKEAFRDHNCEPPTHVWENIQSHLDRRKRKTMIWWWSGVAAVAFIFISAGLWLFESTRAVNEFPVAANTNTIDSVFIEDRNTVAQTTNQIKQTYSQSTLTEIIFKFPDTLPVLAGMYFEGISNPKPTLKLKTEKQNQNFIPLTSKEALQNKIEYQLLLADNHSVINEKKSVKLTISGHFTPTYSSGSYSSSVKDVRGRAYSQKQMDGLMNVGGGLRLSVAANKRFSVQTGISYSRMGQQTDQRANSAQTALLALENTQQIVSTPLGNIKTRTQAVAFRSEQASVLNNIVNTDQTLEQVFGALEIPLQMRYNLNDNKLKFSITGGLCGNFIVSNKIFLNSDDNRELIGSTEDIRNFNLSTDWGLGMEYTLGGKVKVMIEPGFRYFLQSLSQNTGINYKPYMFTFSTGIGIAF